jgi:2-hydroxychromene-2-carboxylate isomerase
MRLTFYYDLVCPFAYLASTQVEALAARAGAEIEWVPILLGGVFRAIADDHRRRAQLSEAGGASDRPAAAMSPQKRWLSYADMMRWADVYGVTLKLHPRHPLRTVDAMRLLHTVDGEARVALTHRLYRAHFVENRDLDERAVLAEFGDVARIDTPEIKDALHQATDRAVADGVFGVPAFVVEQRGQRFLFWGQDRMHFVEKALGGWAVPA